MAELTRDHAGRRARWLACSSLLILGMFQVWQPGWPGILVAAMAGVMLALLSWRGSPSLPWLPWVLPLAALPELCLGQPSFSRLLMLTLLFLAAFPLVHGLSRAGEPGPEALARLRRRLDFATGATLLGWVLLTWLAISFKYHHFGDREIGQDTAYFEQAVWGFVNGHSFFGASSQGWWVYDPPLTSHFAMHCSPLLFLVAGAYALWQSYLVLQLSQILALALAAVPLYLFLRSRDPLAGFLSVLAFLLNTTILTQSQSAFHELALAVPGVAWALYFYLRRRLWPYLGCLLLAILGREDLALLSIMAGVAALLSPAHRAQRRGWVALPILLGAVGWVAAGMVMRAFGSSGGQVILSLFSYLGSTPEEIVGRVLREPWLVFGILLEGHRPRYVAGLLRPNLYLSLGSPLSLLVLPAIAVNTLVRGAGAAWITTHYSIYLPVVLQPAAVCALERWLPRGAALVRTSPYLIRRGLMGLMVLSALFSLPEGINPMDLKAYRPDGDEPALRALLEKIPPDAPVAAPRHLLHALAKRQQLYIVNRWSAYTRYAPEYVLVERDLRRVVLNDGTFPAYAAYVIYLKGDPAYGLLGETRDYRLYHHVGAPGAVHEAAEKDAAP